jgi:hypothetical protein
MAKAAFNKNKVPISSKFDLNLTSKLEQRYIWSTVLCGAETWTLRKLN